MKKKIIKIGNSHGIIFTNADMINYGMIKGDIIDLDDMFLTDLASKRNKYKKLPKISDDYEVYEKVKSEVKK